MYQKTNIPSFKPTINRSLKTTTIMQNGLPKRGRYHHLLICVSLLTPFNLHNATCKPASSPHLFILHSSHLGTSLGHFSRVPPQDVRLRARTHIAGQLPPLLPSVSICILMCPSRAFRFINVATVSSSPPPPSLIDEISLICSALLTS